MWLKVKSLNHKTQNTHVCHTMPKEQWFDYGVLLQFFFSALGICYVVMLVSFCGELRANEGIQHELHESVTI